MLRFDQIRRWCRVGLCGLFCLSVSMLGIAQTAASAGTTTGTSTPAPTSKPAGASHPSTSTSTSHTAASKNKTSHGTSHSTSHGKKTAKKRGQQAIDPARAREIQTALIREHYMEGTPSGTWDAATQAAMQKYQADQGWQSKTTPDSRALIKLGLGPSHDHLLNPESAMTAAPAAGDPKAATKPTPPENSIPQQ
jgi:Putative peptidoglycan binding domain